MTRVDLATPEVRRPVQTLRLLGVGEDTAFKDIAWFAESEGVVLERVPDAAAAVRALAGGGWDMVIVAFDQDHDTELTWWVDVLRSVPRRPRLIALVSTPSI